MKSFINHVFGYTGSTYFSNWHYTRFFHEKPRRQKTDIEICCAVIRISESEKLKTQEYNVVVNENRKAENPWI